MHTRSGKQLLDLAATSKRKRKSVAKLEQLPDGEVSQALQPLRKRQRNGPTSTSALPAQSTSHCDDNIAVILGRDNTSTKTPPVQLASQSNASIVPDSSISRQPPGPAVEDLLNIIRDVSLNSYTCSAVRNYLQSRSRAFRKLCQRDAEHKALLVIQELKKAGVILDHPTNTQVKFEDSPIEKEYGERQGLAIGDDDDDDDNSRYAIGRRQVGERKATRPAVMKPSAELIFQEREEQDDDSDVAISHVRAKVSRSTLARLKRAELPRNPIPALQAKVKKKRLRNPLASQNDDFVYEVVEMDSLNGDHISGVAGKQSGKTTNWNMEAARDEVNQQERSKGNQNKRERDEARALAIVAQEKESSKTARGDVMFTVSEAVQFLARLDENTVTPSAMTEEIKTGEFLSYPVEKPYHLGAMGRYGKEAFVSNTRRMSAPSLPSSVTSMPQYGHDGSVDTPSNSALSHPTPLFQASRHNKYRMPTGPYAGYTFKSVPHSYLRLLQANPIEFEQYEGLREVFDSCWPTGMPDPSPVTYRFSFGPHLGRKLEDVPEEYRLELEASEEVKHPKSRHLKSLAAALKFQKSKHDGTSSVVNSSLTTDMATDDTHTLTAPTVKPNPRRNPKTYRGHVPFVFEHGRWAGVNIDTVPKHYLLQLQEHPDELAKHQGLQETLQLRFPDGLRTQVN